MTRIRFEDLPSTNTPRNATNLNKLNNVVISSTEPTTGEEVWIQKGKNLFNKDKIVKGYYLNSGGSISTSANFSLSEYIEVKSGKQYTYQGLTNTTNSSYAGYYDASKNFVSSFLPVSTSETITIPSGVSFVRFSIRTASENENTFQLEQGSSATSYEAYIDKKIYVKNSDTYQNFYNEQKFEKNAITVGISTDFTTSNTSGETLPLNTVINKIGDKLSLDNNKIVIGKDVNYVLVSGAITYKTTTTSNGKARTLIRLNSSALLTAECKIKSADSIQHTISTAIKLAVVKEGDVISLDCQQTGNSGAVIEASVNQTFLTVIAL